MDRSSYCLDMQAAAEWRIGEAGFAKCERHRATVGQAGGMLPLHRLQCLARGHRHVATIMFCSRDQRLSTCPSASCAARTTLCASTAKYARNAARVSLRPKPSVPSV